MSARAPNFPAPPAAPGVVVTADAARRARASALARSLALPFVEAAGEAALRLVLTEDRLELHDPAGGARLYVEYRAAELRRYRAARGPDPLRRALGPAGRCVIDATAGLGGDAVRLAVLGYRVVAVERDPVVDALARDGLRRAHAAGLLDPGNPVWLTGDAREVLPTLEPADAVYLDPMFPPKRKKSAATRKEMDLLRRLTASDDAAGLLAAARRAARERVVVKRPLEAPPLGPGVTAAYRGKLVRYDVYRTDR